MLRSAIPNRFQLPWGKNAGGAFIRTPPLASQIGIQDGAASFNDGFVPDNFTALAGGGVPPFGQDFNGILNITTSWDQWYQAGAPISYDSTFATAIGGYPQGAVLGSAVTIGAQWFSTVDSNLTNPDDPLTSVGWARIGLPAGTPIPTLLPSSMPTGYVAMNALTIGNAASGAGYANADSLFLFVHNWTAFSNTQCPILTSTGSASTRGANPVADFNANKRLTLPNGKGLGLMGADTMLGSASTFLTGIPVTSGNATTPGSLLGENLHQLTTAELGSHSHPNSLVDPGHIHTIADPGHVHGVTGGFFGGTGNFPFNATGASDAVANHASVIISSAVTSISINSHTTGASVSNGGAGGDLSHNTVHRSMVVFWGQKL